MSKASITIVILIMIIIALAIFIYVRVYNNDNSNTNTIVKTECPDGYFYYSSQYSSPTGRGDEIVVGEQEGDLLCHIICETNDDCGNDNGVCVKTTYNRGDTINITNICSKGIEPN
ncbi:MAG: hypothetical protein V1838_02080 [Patescibacteria group bacterium]